MQLICMMRKCGFYINVNKRALDNCTSLGVLRMIREILQ